MNDVVELVLPCGCVTTIDAEDEELVSPYRWALRRSREVSYVAAEGFRNNERYWIAMHRLVMHAQPGQIIDHIDRNPLNNRKSNLRFCTQQQNSWNRGPMRNRSGFKGVSWESRARKWRALINISGKRYHLGYFVDPVEAARAFDRAAMEKHGEFAYLNFPAESQR